MAPFHQHQHQSADVASPINRAASSTSSSCQRQRQRQRQMQRSSSWQLVAISYLMVAIVSCSCLTLVRASWQDDIQPKRSITLGKPPPTYSLYFDSLHMQLHSTRLDSVFVFVFPYKSLSLSPPHFITVIITFASFLFLNIFCVAHSLSLLLIRPTRSRSSVVASTNTSNLHSTNKLTARRREPNIKTKEDRKKLTKSRQFPQLVARC